MFASHISNSIMRALRLSAPGVPEALLHKRLLAFPPPAARSLLIRGRNTQVCVNVKSSGSWYQVRFLVITHPDVHAGMQSSTETAPKPVDLATAGGRVCTGQWT